MNTLSDLIGSFPIAIHRDVDADDFWFTAKARHNGVVVSGDGKRTVQMAVASLLEKAPNIFSECVPPPTSDDLLTEIRDELIDRIDGGIECLGRDAWLTSMADKIDLARTQTHD